MNLFRRFYDALMTKIINTGHEKTDPDLFDFEIVYEGLKTANIPEDRVTTSRIRDGVIIKDEFGLPYVPLRSIVYFNKSAMDFPEDRVIRAGYIHGDAVLTESEGNMMIFDKLIKRMFEAAASKTNGNLEFALFCFDHEKNRWSAEIGNPNDAVCLGEIAPMFAAEGSSPDDAVRNLIALLEISDAYVNKTRTPS